MVRRRDRGGPALREWPPHLRDRPWTDDEFREWIPAEEWEPPDYWDLGNAVASARWWHRARAGQLFSAARRDWLEQNGLTYRDMAPSR